MVESPSKATRSSQSAKLSLIRLIRPHWKELTLAFVAVLGETLSDVLEPWPIKVVVDNDFNRPGFEDVAECFTQNRDERQSQLFPVRSDQPDQAQFCGLA